MIRLHRSGPYMTRCSNLNYHIKILQRSLIDCCMHGLFTVSTYACILLYYLLFKHIISASSCSYENYHCHKLIANMLVPFISLKSYHLYQQIADKGSPTRKFSNSINANLEPCIWNHSKYTSILIISEVHYRSN